MPQVSCTYCAWAWMRAAGSPACSAVASASAITSAASGKSRVYARTRPEAASASARAAVAGSPASTATASTVSSIALSWSPNQYAAVPAAAWNRACAAGLASASRPCTPCRWSHASFGPLDVHQRGGAQHRELDLQVGGHAAVRHRVGAQPGEQLVEPVQPGLGRQPPGQREPCGEPVVGHAHLLPGESRVRRGGAGGG